MIPLDLAGEPAVVPTTEIGPASVGLNRFDLASKLGCAVETHCDGGAAPLYHLS
jgi:hypothetical protein